MEGAVARLFVSPSRAPALVGVALLTFAAIGTLVASGLAPILDAPGPIGGELQRQLPYPEAAHGASSSMGALAVAYPWWGGLTYAGANTTGVQTFAGNVTIPSTIADRIGYNYTVEIEATDGSCTTVGAGIEDSAGTWRFHWSVAPFGAPPQQGWALHLAPGDTYQLVIVSVGGNAWASIYNVSHANEYNSTGSPEATSGPYLDGANGLALGPYLCGGVASSPDVSLIVRSVGGGSTTFGPSRDLFLQNESFYLLSSPWTPFQAPNLWSPYFRGAPANFAPEQSWATADLIVQATDHPVDRIATTTAPLSDVDIGMTASVGIVGTPATVPAGENDYAFAQVEFGDAYPGASALSFANCQSLNGSNSNPGYPGGDTGYAAEYGYASNTTTVSIHLGYVLDPTTNFSLDYRCYTQPLTTTGNLTIWGLSYLTYPWTGSTSNYVDALSSGPREPLGMNALAWNVAVHALPVAGVSTPTPAVVVGQSASFVAWERGGSPTLTYQWFVDGSVQSGCTSLTCALVWATPGSHQVWMAATDAFGARAVSSHLNETVDPALSSSIFPYPSAAATLGAPLTLSAAYTGGTGGNSFTFWRNGSLSPVQLQGGPSGTYALVLTHGGTYQVWVDVNDSSGNVAVSSHTNVTETLALTAVLSPLSGRTEPGAPPSTLSVSVAGGRGGYVVSWYVPGALTASGTCWAQCNLTGVAPGTYEVWVGVTDSGGSRNVSAHANLTVLPALVFSSWQGPSVVDAGANDSFGALYAGGAPPDTYQWDLNGVPVPYCTLVNCSVVVPSASAAKLQVNATDALGVTAMSTPFWVVSAPPLSVSLSSPRPPTLVEVGQAVGILAKASNGAGGDAYGFLTSAAPGIAMGVGPWGNFSWAPVVPGNYQVWAEANDSTGYRVVSAHVNVTVVSALALTVLPAPLASVSVGTWLNASASVTGGSAPFVLTWYSDGALQGSCTGSYCDYLWSSAGTHQIWAAVTDGLGVRNVAPHTNVTVTTGSLVLVTFLVGPTGSGTIRVNGIATPSGNVSGLLPGDYQVQALALPGFSFAGWYASNPTGLLLRSASATTTTLQVNGGSASGGTVVAEFSAPLSFSVVVQVSPPSTANLTVNGTPTAIGSTLTLREGVYPLQASPGPGRGFLSWVTQGAVNVSWDLPSTLMEVGGNGTVEAETTSASGISPTLYAVSLSVSPSGLSTVLSIGTTTYAPGTVIDVPAGRYALAVTVPSGYTFQGWATTGGASVASLGSSSTQLLVTGNGTLTADLTRSGPGGIFGLGLSTTTLEVFALLLVVLVAVILIGASRHRSHGQQRGANPPPAQAPESPEATNESYEAEDGPAYDEPN